MNDQEYRKEKLKSFENGYFKYTFTKKIREFLRLSRIFLGICRLERASIELLIPLLAFLDEVNQQERLKF